MTFTVVLLKELDGRYSVLVPSLKGCATWGETLPQALRMAEEAILGHLEGLRELDLPVPDDDDTVTFEMGEATEAAVYRVSIDGVTLVA